MTPPNYKLVLCAVLASSLLAACGKRIEVTTNAPNLALSVSSCKEPWAPPGPPPFEKIRWIEANTLEIRARGEMSCEVDRVSAAYAVSRTTLELGYAGSLSQDAATKPPPECRCIHDFVYVISNLPKRNYRIVVENIPRAGTQAKWKARQLK